MCIGNSDEDMQSVASLMSMGKTDIGNLGDLEEDDEEETTSNVGSEMKQQVTSEIRSITSKMLQLDAHFGNPFPTDDDPEDVESDALNPFDSFGIAPFLVLFAVLHFNLKNILLGYLWTCSNIIMT